VPVHHRRGRTIGLVTIAVLALTATACSSKDDAGGGSGDDGASTETTVDAAAVLGEENPATDTPITIGVVTDGVSSFGDAEAMEAITNGTAEYANDYLGGLNGHVIEVDQCATDGTPSGATQCAVQMVEDDVAAVLVPVSAQDAILFEGLADSGIPYVTYTSAAEPILLQPGAFLLTNPISQIAGPGVTAQENGDDKVGFIIIDVPAATGPITAIAEPIYEALGIDLQIIPISPQVADMTPQVQEAMGTGADVFTVTGTDDFNASAVNALDQLGFEGDVVLGNPSQILIDQLTSGVENITSEGTVTEDPSDPDVQLYQAVLDTYMGDVEPDSGSAQGFATVLAFVRALDGVTDAVDAESIDAALSGMPEPIDLPLGGGITFQCGSAPVSFAPGICSTDVLRWSYNADGQPQDYGLLEVPADALTLG
jgi:branched-chain amino acid transport system substrate-binding protein